MLAEVPWDLIDLHTLAHRAAVPLAKIQKTIPDTMALLPILVAFMDRQVLKASPPDPSLSAEEQLFELLMARFEVMQPYRSSLTVLADLSRRRPPLAFALASLELKSLQKNLSRYGIIKKTSRTPHLPLIILGLYHIVFYRWLDDESLSLQRTMACLNATLHTCKISTLIRA